MDFSKLLNAIRGNKAADASAAPKDRSETEPVIPVEVSPTVAAADHPPPVRTSGSVVQSLLSQFTGGHREPPPAAPARPQPPNNGYDDVLASVLPPAPAPVSAPPPAVEPSTDPEGMAPLDGDWFDVSLEAKPVPPATAADVPVLDLPVDVPVPNAPQTDVLDDAPLSTSPTAPLADPFEVQGRVDLSWTPAEAPAATSPAGEHFASQEGWTETGGMSPGQDLPVSPPATIPPPLADSPPLETFPVAGSAYGPPMAFAPDAGGFSQDPQTTPPLSPVSEWGFSSSTPAAMSSGDAVPVAAAETAATVPSSPSPSWSDWMVENLDEALLLLDDQGVIQQANPMAEYLLGVPRHELVGQSLLDISQRCGGDNAPLWEHLAVTSEAQQFSTNVTLPDGQALMASFVVLELAAHATWPGGRIIAIRDETRLRAEFAQMMEDLAPPPSPASALQVTPEQLMAMRTSLQMVLGFAELLHRGEYGPMNPQQFEMFRNIEHHAKQLAEWLGLPQ